MKRSAMLRELERILYPNVNQGRIDAQAVAMDVLYAVEKMGMLPPFSREAALKSDHIDAPGHDWDEE